MRLFSNYLAWFQLATHKEVTLWYVDLEGGTVSSNSNLGTIAE